MHRLTTNARERGRRKAWLLLALLGLNGSAPAVAQAPPVGPSAAVEPIAAIPQPPAQDPRRVVLGERLFHDERLSHGNDRSCSSCHDIRRNGASPRGHDLTPDGREIFLNTPTIFNATLSFRFNWEGNVRDLNDQTQRILSNPDIMATSMDEVLKRLRADPGMVRQFLAAYGREPDRTTLLDAIATYERSLLTPGSRFDRWLAGDAGAITQEELAGYQLFKSLGCIACHQGVNIGGNLYQRHGIFHPLAAPQPEVLRVPSLRNVATTPPYFHDGSAPTLPKAIKAMGYAQLDITLTDRQTDLLVAFLNTLTGTYGGKPVTPATAQPQAKAPPP